MFSKLYEFITDLELIARLSRSGVKYGQKGGAICLLDKELNEAGICFHADRSGEIRTVEVEMDYIEDKSKFKEFLKKIKEKYSLGTDVRIETRIKSFMPFYYLEDKLKGKEVYSELEKECIFDNELNSEICFETTTKYGEKVVKKVKVKTDRIEDKSEFMNFLEKLRAKYGLSKNIYVDVGVKDFVLYRDLKEKLAGKKSFVGLGRECIFDEELNAEICFEVKPRYGDFLIVNVEVKTTYIGKEKFRDFLNKLRAKYSLPQQIPVNVSAIPEKNLEETKEFYSAWR